MEHFGNRSAGQGQQHVYNASTYNLYPNQPPYIAGEMEWYPLETTNAPHPYSDLIPGYVRINIKTVCKVDDHDHNTGFTSFCGKIWEKRYTCDIRDSKFDEY
ncbi:unnamed protein product [Gongylonema pulchrum]|uniref:Helitron helicase n=1 Tax=Gongylonema pulchrum TaxID=637853 RepID=A0A183EHF4_9BILA|nr:unnamed protein product [Gongylonema pulchrum]